MRALDQAVELGKRRFLIELPTGTGKTDLICLYLKRLIRAGRAERVFFLVDREQLAKQALEAMQDILNRHGSYWLKPGMIRQEQQITVCLLQTMIGRYQEFTSGYFDVVIADECHRSIYGAWQTALTHFDALHIGLTATPAAYIERNTFQLLSLQGQRSRTSPTRFKKLSKRSTWSPTSSPPASPSYSLRVQTWTMSTTTQPSSSANGPTRTPTAR